MSTALMLKNKEKSIKIEMPFNTQSLNNVESTLFLEEVKNYLCSYPKTKHIDICLHDINGHIRGKRIDISCLNKLADGCYFPLSVYAMSLDGKVIEETGLGKFIGEPDFLCKPILGSLKPCPIDPELNAQLFLTMKDNESDCQFEPKNLLKGILSKLHDVRFRSKFLRLLALSPCEVWLY